MKCRECDEFLVDYVAGELPADVLADLRASPVTLPELPRLPGSISRDHQGRKPACDAVEGRAADPEELIQRSSPPAGLRLPSLNENEVKN